MKDKDDKSQMTKEVKTNTQGKKFRVKDAFRRLSLLLIYARFQSLFFLCWCTSQLFFFLYLFYFSWTSFYLEVLFFHCPCLLSLSLFHSIDTFWFQRGRSADDRLGHYCNFDKVFCKKKKKNCWLSICTSIQWQADWIKTSLGKNDFLRLFSLSLSLKYYFVYGNGKELANSHGNNPIHLKIFAI